MSYEEESIARTQLKGTDGVGERQNRGIAYLDERILIYLGAIAFVLLCVVWATIPSPLILYGSLVFVILQVVLWGVVRIKRIERTRQERALQVEAARIERARR
jgi:hypothetical protein